ncbi:hypothetical protein RJT34_11243 [Clitoria ternatea]|uniref:Subtilisin-like protease fibronectin type-III domain-containing protein n=1 Tax=Clitoria ternatea TaxID=43366 RepID=A0AAN9JN96_CLITE
MRILMRRSLITTGYFNFLCASGYTEALLKLFDSLKTSYTTCPISYNIEDFNYPSITVHHHGPNPLNVTRTITNVGPPSTYVVSTRKDLRFVFNQVR